MTAGAEKPVLLLSNKCSSEELEFGLYLLGKVYKPAFAEGKLVVCSLF